MKNAENQNFKNQTSDEKVKTEWSLADREKTSESRDANREDTERVRAENVRYLKDAIDLSKIAAEKDPEGWSDALAYEAQSLSEIDGVKEGAAKRARQIEIEESQINAKNQSVRSLGVQAAKRERQFSHKFKSKLGMKDKKFDKINAEIAKVRAEEAELSKSMLDVKDRQGRVEDEIAAINPDARKSELEKKFETPLRPDEKKEHLKFDALASLSTDEYLKLWRRLNPYYISHVTRQGVRDHTSHHYSHDKEFCSGFTDIISGETKGLEPRRLNEFDLDADNISEDAVKRVIDEAADRINTAFEDPEAVNKLRADARRETAAVSDASEGHARPVNWMSSHSIARANKYFGAYLPLDSDGNWIDPDDREIYDPTNLFARDADLGFCDKLLEQTCLEGGARRMEKMGGCWMYSRRER